MLVAFVEQIVRNLVDHPEQVRITAVNGEKTAMLELRFFG